MAKLASLEELWRQSVELNIRYYSALGQLSTAYLKDLTELLADVREAQPQRSVRPLDDHVVASHPPQAAKPTPQAGVMVLEGEAGGQALGVFLVANHLSEEVSARVVTSSFVSDDGLTIEPTFTFDPEVITLAPNEQLLVRVMTIIDESLEPGLRYVGEFTIPELSGTRIPIVVRSRAAVDEPQTGTESTDDASSK